MLVPVVPAGGPRGLDVHRHLVLKGTVQGAYIKGASRSFSRPRVSNDNPQAEAQFKIAEQDLILRVAQAYFDVLIAQDSVQLAEAQKSAELAAKDAKKTEAAGPAAAPENASNAALSA